MAPPLCPDEPTRACETRPGRTPAAAGLDLWVDGTSWSAHHRAVLGRYPGLVPVVKGNGYGFGIEVLGRVAARLGTDMVAAGTDEDARRLAAVFPGRILVLAPGLGAQAFGRAPGRFLYHVISPQHLDGDRADRAVLQVRTSMHGPGLDEHEMAALAARPGGAHVEGIALSLPLERPRHVDPAAEVARWIGVARHAGLDFRHVYVNHLHADELAALARRFPSEHIRSRIGTELWLGAPAALDITATVLDVTTVRRGERCGYRQGRVSHAGALLTVAGGSAHGVGLESPRHLRGRTRLEQAARSALALTNRNLSPFAWRGRRLWFAEPPHMLTSLVLAPEGSSPPTPGDVLTAQLRHTTTTFDHVLWQHEVPAADTPRARSGPTTGSDAQ